MVGIRSVGVGVGEHQSEDSFVCFGTKPTQRACMQYFLQDRKKTRKSKVPEQRTDWSLQQSGKGNSQRQVATEVEGWDLWTQKPGQPVQEDESVLQVAVWKFFGVHACNARKVPKLLLSYA